MVSQRTRGQSRLKNLAWVGAFFLVLAAITTPLIFLSKAYKFEFSVYYMAIVIMATSVICQLLRKESTREIFGGFNITWFKFLGKGLLVGGVLMLIPSLFLYISGIATWQLQAFDVKKLLSGTALFVAVAVSEEVLFRGFLFQRLIGALGRWPAQIIIAGLFLLTHMGNPGMEGTTKLLAGINIFVASLLFGIAFLKTRSLAMPIGIHFMANWMQGIFLGFGVSGNEEPSLLKPVLKDSPEWLTGGAFGLEASLPLLVCVIIFVMLLMRMKKQAGKFSEQLDESRGVKRSTSLSL